MATMSFLFGLPPKSLTIRSNNLRFTMKTSKPKMHKVRVTSSSTQTGVEPEAIAYYQLYKNTELILLLNQTSFAEAVGLCNRIGSGKYVVAATTTFPGDEKAVVANLRGLRTMKATLRTEVSPTDLKFKEEEAEEDHQDVNIFTFNKIIYPDPVVDSLHLFLTSASKKTVPNREMHVYAEGLLLATEVAIYKDIATKVNMTVRLFSLANANRTLAIFKKLGQPTEVEEEKKAEVEEEKAEVEEEKAEVEEEKAL